MTQRYHARFTNEALMQLMYLRQHPHMSKPLGDLVTAAEGWSLYGPVALDLLYEARTIVDHGQFHCGSGHELLIERMCAIFSVSHDEHVMTICWIEEM